MRNDSDPLQNRTEHLTEALTTARSRAQSANGLLWVQACADGEITINIDDHALTLTGEELSRQLTRLAARALATAREQAASALAEFRADPHFDAAVWETRDAMDRPHPSRHPSPDLGR